MLIKWPWLGGKSGSRGEAGEPAGGGQSFSRGAQRGSWSQDPWLCQHGSDQPLGGLRWLSDTLGLSFLACKLWVSD